MTVVLESALKVALVVFAALAVNACCRRQSAALRHWILAAAVTCSLCIPVFFAVFGSDAPRWRIAIESPRIAPPAALATAPPPQRARADVTASSSAAASAGLISGVDASLAGLVVWLGGTSLGFLMLALGLGRLAWLARRSAPMNDMRWTAMAAEVSASLGLNRPVTLLRSASPHALMTWGAASPKVMVPADAQTWSDDRVRIVLGHELAHVRRGDWFIQIAAECLRTAYWFNPLVWIACRRLRRESEHACDDAVLALGIDGTQYATELLEIARSAGQQRSWLPAPAMAQTSNLERRVKAMLNATLNRRPIPRGTRVSVVAVALVCAVALTGLTISGQTFSSLSGSIFDATNRVVPNVTMRLTNTQSGAQYTIKSDADGRYEFVGLPPGDYELLADLPGFSALRGTVTMIGKNATQNVTLQVGSLEETLTVVDGAPPAAPRPQSAPPAFVTKPCEPKAVGGSIRPPAKLRDARPIYPETYRNSGHTETVVLQAVIDRDGTIKEVNPVGTPTLAFANAAVDAVRQWQFSQTLLNCEPTEVRMTVTLRFSKLVASAPPGPGPRAAAQDAGRVRLQLTLSEGAAPLLILRSGQTGSVRMRSGYLYFVTPTVMDTASGSVDLKIQGVSPYGQQVETHVMTRVGETLPATGHSPFSLSLLDITR